MWSSVKMHIVEHGAKYATGLSGFYAAWYFLPLLYFGGKNFHTEVKRDKEFRQERVYCENLLDDALEKFDDLHYNRGFFDVREIPLFLGALEVPYTILPSGIHSFSCTSYGKSYVSPRENGFVVYLSVSDLERYVHEKN
jgi:hypothetical protein